MEDLKLPTINITPIQKNRIMVLLFLIPFLLGTDVDLYVPSIPQIERYFDTQKHFVQLTISFYMLGYALGQVLLGILSDSFGRKKILVTHSIHTEKHRGYHYEHAFSYNWNAMQGFHLLMRLAHAVNALSEFTKKLKQWIKEQGCLAILKVIKGTLFNPWLPKEWYEKQHQMPARLILQIE